MPTTKTKRNKPTKKRATPKPAAKRTTPKRRTTPKKPSRRAHKPSMPNTAFITGSFDGHIVANGQLCIARGAQCNANMKASSMQIDGKVRGMVVASNTMKLGSQCQVHGTIVTDKLVAADGAVFNGQCRLGRYRKAA